MFYFGVFGVILDLEEDLGCLGKIVDVFIGWVGLSNYWVSLMGLEILSVFVDRLLICFKFYVVMVIVVLIDRMGDVKDKV